MHKMRILIKRWKILKKNRFLASGCYNRHAFPGELLCLYLALDAVPSPDTWGLVHSLTVVGTEGLTIGLNQQQATSSK